MGCYLIGKNRADGGRERSFIMPRAIKKVIEIPRVGVLLHRYEPMFYNLIVRFCRFRCHVEATI